MTSREVFGLHSEVLELHDGKYRYWFLGDVGPRIPLEQAGRYTMKADRIFFDRGSTGPEDRLLVSDDGERRLLRRDAEESWKKDGNLNPYGTLTRVPFSFQEMTPSLDYDEDEWRVLLPKLPILRTSG